MLLLKLLLLQFLLLLQLLLLPQLPQLPPLQEQLVFNNKEPSSFNIKDTCLLELHIHNNNTNKPQCNNKEPPLQ